MFDKLERVMLPAIALAMAAILAHAPQATAQDSDAEAEAGRKWVLGLGIATIPDYEGSNDYTFRPILTGSVTWANGRYLQLAGVNGAGTAARLRYNFLRRSTLDFGPVLQVRAPRGDFVSNNKVENLRNIDPAVEGGVFVGIRRGNLGGDLTSVRGITEHSGYVIEIAPYYKNKIGETFSWRVTPFLNWASKEYQRKYFGVGPNDSLKSGLPEYRGSKGLKDSGVTLATNWKPGSWEHWSFTSFFRYARMIQNADDDSPVVDIGSENQFYGGLALMWNN